MNRIFGWIPKKLILPCVAMLGLFCGLAAYATYMSRAHSYLSDDPAACVNCHVMASYYQSWDRSSHAQWATCNDCHIPNNGSIIETYSFKAMDGLRHATAFTLGTESQVPRANDGSSGVIMQNCIRCHQTLNTEFVTTGLVTYADTMHGQGQACWDCHREVPHTRVSGLSSAAVPSVGVPLPVKSKQTPNAPEWSKNIINQQ